MPSFSKIAAAAAVVVFASTAATAEEYRAAPSWPTFPEQFVVSTGLTIPFDDTDPVAQSGTIYFDYPNQRMRIDADWMGTQRTFMVDMKAQRGYLTSNQGCVTSALTGTLKPMQVPKDASRSDERASVRGVTADQFTSIERAEDLVQVEHFVKKINFTVVNKDQDVSLAYWIPWRQTTRRTSRKEIAAAPLERPNWRFFGEPLYDELVKFEDHSSHALSRVTRDVAVTLDYYNFVPMMPDPSVFEVPGRCVHAPTETFSHDVDVSEAHRHLTMVTFNNEEGRRLMEELFREARRKRIDDPIAETATEEEVKGDL